MAKLAVPASSRTWYVKADGTGDALTIQSGVDMAAAGDTVLVAPGVYDDTTHVDIDGQARAVNVYIAKDIRLASSEGAGTVTVDGTKSDYAVVVVGGGSQTAVSGFDIVLTGFSFGCVQLQQEVVRGAVFGTTGIRCLSTTCEVSANTIADADYGVVLIGSNATVTDSRFSSVSYGVRSEGVSVPSVSNNLFENCGVGVSSFESSPRIEGNTMTRDNGAAACRGIECANGAQNGADVTPFIKSNRIVGMQSEAVWCTGVTATIENNVVEGGAGVWVNFCGQTVARGNVVVGSTYGFLLQGTPSVLLESNTIHDNTIGLGIVNGTAASVQRNIIVSGTVGVDCLMASAQLTCNDVFGMPIKYRGACADQTGVGGNFSADPQFCGNIGTGNYMLQSDSPCAPQGHPDGADCGLIGARAVGCGTVATKNATWGAVKGLYKGERKN